MLTLILSNPQKTRNVFLDEKIYSIMCNLTLGLCVVETLTFCIDGQTFFGAIFLNRVLNALLFVTNSVFSFLWTVYVDYKLFGQVDRLKKIYPYVAIPAAMVSLMGILNIFIDIFFTVTPDNVYLRTPIAVISYLTTYGYLMAGAIMVFIFHKKIGKYLFMPVIVFLMPIFIGSLLQMLYYGIALIWVSVSFGLISLYINLQNEASMLDSLTKLYNREYLTRYLNYMLQKSSNEKQIAGIMMDINAFKEINDVYGHSEGDTALRIVGQCLMDVLSGDQFAVRYGGDEFIVILTIHQKKEIDVVIHQICQKIERLNNTDVRPYRISLSMGSAILQPGGENIDSFLQQMDEHMYQNKRAYYSDSKNDRRRTGRISSSVK